FFQAEDGIRDATVTGVQTLLFRSERPADKDAILLAVVMRLGAGCLVGGSLFHFAIHHHNLSPASNLASISCWNSGGPKPKRSPRSEERRVGKKAWPTWQ